MPQRVICHECRYVLYERTELCSIDEIIHRYGGICPKCNRKLSFLPLNVEVTSVNK